MYNSYTSNIYYIQFIYQQHILYTIPIPARYTIYNSYTSNIYYIQFIYQQHILYTFHFPATYTVYISYSSNKYCIQFVPGVNGSTSITCYNIYISSIVLSFEQLFEMIRNLKINYE